MEDCCSILLAACFWTFSIKKGDPLGNNLHQTKYVILNLEILVMWCGCHYASRIIAPTTPLWLSTTVSRRCCTSILLSYIHLFFGKLSLFYLSIQKGTFFPCKSLGKKTQTGNSQKKNTYFFLEVLLMIHLVPSRCFPNGRTISC